MQVPEWLDEIRLEPGPPFATMGTHSLALADWLIIDEHRADDLAHKATLLATVESVVFAALPDAHAPSNELLGIIRTSLSDNGIEVPPPFGDGHPLIEAARLVQEDLAVLQRLDEEWVLTAGVVCFPTHWTVGDKVGLPLAGIHEPVAHYEEELRERVDRFHDRLTPQRPVWRRNWFVVPTNELHLPTSAARPPIAPLVAPLVAPIGADGSPMWIRSERQTLRRLPESDAIVFTIRVQQAPLGVLRRRRDLAAKMLESARSWDAEKRMYTSTGAGLDHLITWLEGLGEIGSYGSDD